MALLFLGGCASSHIKLHRLPATSPANTAPWTPPAGTMENAPLGPALPKERYRELLKNLSIAAAVDIALRNNPATKAAWADARAAAARYGSARGIWYPALNLGAAFVRSRGLPEPSSSGIQPANPITDYNVTANFSYLLFDFGERSALVKEARQALLAANWTQNSVIQNTILQAELAYLAYAEAKSLLEAHQTSLAEAEANLTAAEERHRVGLATNADALQAKTAYSEAKLVVLGSEGQVRIAKAALAVTMGFPANISGGLEIIVPQMPTADVVKNVDQLIGQALASRPDLQVARAYARESAAKVAQAQSRIWPTLSATGYLSRIWITGLPGFNDTYGAALSLQVPLFNGFARQYDVLSAKAQAEAAEARLRGVEQAVIFQVYAAYSDFLTAGERVKTTVDLMSSAGQSAEVALGRYKEGVGSILDLLSAQRALATARAEQINAHLGWFVALAQLAHDVGVLGVHGENPLAADALTKR